MTYYPAAREVCSGAGGRVSVLTRPPASFWAVVSVLRGTCFTAALRVAGHLARRWSTMDAMQLRLIVMRHAKAGELPGGPDAERALTERGRRDSAAAGRWLRASGFVPERGHLLRGPADPADLAAAVGRARRAEPELHARAGAVRGRRGRPAGDRRADARCGGARCCTSGTTRPRPSSPDDLTGTELHFPTAAIAVIALPGAVGGPGRGPAASCSRPGRPRGPAAPG